MKRRMFVLTGYPGTGDESLISSLGVALGILMAEAQAVEGRRPWWVPGKQLTRRNIYEYMCVCVSRGFIYTKKEKAF